MSNTAYEKQVINLLESIKKDTKDVPVIIEILETIHKTLNELLAAVTAEDSGDLVAALRKLTEAINTLVSRSETIPSEVVKKFKIEIPELVK